MSVPSKTALGSNPRAAALIPRNRVRGQAVRVGLVGCGRVTEERHLPALRGLPGAEAVALADINSERLNALADRFQVDRRYTDYRDLLAQPDVEIVAVLVPTQFHVEIALAALDAGKHVLIEKPLALNLDDCERLLEGASAGPGKVLVGFNMRWHRLVVQARERIQRGTLGQIRAVRSVYTHWRAKGEAPPWTKQRLLGGGVIMNEAVHHFDLWRFLLSTEIEEVSAVSQATDEFEDETSSVLARLTGGVQATGIFSLKTGVNNEIEIYGAGGRLYISCYRFDGLEFHARETYPGDIPARLRKLPATLGQLPQVLTKRGLGGDFVASFAAEWQHFADLVRHGGESGCTIQDGVRSLQVALASMHSASTGQPVQVAQAPRTITPV